MRCDSRPEIENLPLRICHWQFRVLMLAPSVRRARRKARQSGDAPEVTGEPRLFLTEINTVFYNEA